MVTDDEHAHARYLPSAERVYSPDILPKLQSLLADLADIDLGYRMDVEAIRRRPLDPGSKRETIERLRQHHHERRIPIVRELSALENRTRAACCGSSGSLVREGHGAAQGTRP